jgi:hypothetical protein
MPLNVRAGNIHEYLILRSLRLTEWFGFMARESLRAVAQQLRITFADCGGA